MAFAICCALRLARFNITRGGATEKKVFLGLPSPAAAGLLVGFIWASADFGIDGSTLVLPVLALTIAAGALMVSNVRYASFKDLDFGERVPFRYILIMLVVFVAIVIDPARILFLGFLIYALSGPIQALRRRRRRHTPG